MTGGTRRRAVRVAAVLTLSAALSACGLTAPRDDEGFAALESPGIADTERTLALSIGPTLLRFAARHTEDDPEAQALLRGLDGVRVRIYEITGDSARVAGRLRRSSRDMQARGWEPVAVLRDAGEEAHMLVRTSGERITGMVVMVADGPGREVVMVNIMGDLEPAMFGDAMAALDVPAPEVALAAAD